VVAFVAPDTVERWGLSTFRYGTVFETDGSITPAQQARITDHLHGSSSDQCRPLWYPAPGCGQDELRTYLQGPVLPANSTATAQFALRPSDLSRDEPYAALVGFGASLLFTLLVGTFALALTAAESRDERALLEAVGAPPAVRRSLAAWQALLLPALATLLAVPGALALSYVLFRHEADAGFRIPWLAVALLVVSLPLASAGLTWLGTALIGRKPRDLSPWPSPPTDPLGPNHRSVTCPRCPRITYESQNATPRPDRGAARDRGSPSTLKGSRPPRDVTATGARR
jgi:hypothetical protein